MNLWLRSLGPDETGPQRDAEPPPQSADVAVVGAGFTGLSAALQLCERGASVAVLEARTVAYGASGRNGGMVLTGLKRSPHDLLRRYGLDAARAMFGASLDAIDLVESLVARYGIACDFARTGHLEVAAKPSHYRALAAAAEVLRTAFGHRTALLRPHELSAEIGSAAFAGGLLDERSAGLHPACYARGLALAAMRLGASVCESTEVTAIEGGPQEWTVRTNRGQVRARNVLVATGAYSESPFTFLQKRLVPIGSYVIATEQLTESLARELIPRNRMIFDSRRLLHYFRLTPDGRMLFGGRAAFFPETPQTTARSAEILRRDMIAIFPALGHAAVEYCWGGTLDVTFDVMPHAGVIDGVHYAAGYAGHGVALATLLGARTADAMLDGTALHPFGAPLPRAPLGLYNGRPWFLPIVGIAARLLDAID